VAEELLKEVKKKNLKPFSSTMLLFLPGITVVEILDRKRKRARIGMLCCISNFVQCMKVRYSYNKTALG
jgi:hypothetical protein